MAQPGLSISEGSAYRRLIKGISYPLLIRYFAASRRASCTYRFFFVCLAANYEIFIHIFSSEVSSSLNCNCQLSLHDVNYSEIPTCCCECYTLINYTWVALHFISL